MISFILPVCNCYGEFAAKLPDLISSLKQLGDEYEIIVVDDGSRDGESVMLAAVRHGCVYLRNERNRGKGYAVRRGMERAGGEVLIFMDGDFPFAPETALRVAGAFSRPEYDLVIGDRTLPASVYPHDIGWMRKAGSWVLSLFAGNLFTRGIYDTQCGIKGFRRRVAGPLFRVMRIDGFAFDLELLYVALKRNYVIARVPVETRKQAASNVRVLRHGMETIGDLVRIRINALLGRYRA